MTSEQADTSFDTAALGRYRPVRMLGKGGAGVVWEAHDPQLDRKVAIKLIRTDRAERHADASGARARLLRESHALARLNHPNVVEVYDVGAEGNQVFVVMELVEGVTLKRWRTEKPRTYRETVRVFLQAGRGLAVAHAAGLVHRDFKPANVMLGRDGRVRVLDFGLARPPKGPGDARSSEASAAGPETDRSISSGRLDDRLTQTGYIVGTPHYMAPEIFRGRPADERSDQFSYCVALYEALYGHRPFEGKTWDDLAAAVLGGRLREPPSSNVPVRVRRIVLRGLRADPSGRYPTMEALLSDLSRDPAVWRRRWSLAAGVVASAAAIVGYAASGSGATVCADSAAKLSGVWDTARRDAVDAAVLATDVPYAADTSTRLRTVLDDYANRWVDLHASACEADDMFDRRMLCLNRRLVGLRALVDVLAAADAAVVQRAIKAANDLDRLERCTDPHSLASGAEPPGDPATAQAVERLRARLADAKALTVAGRYDDALKPATWVVDEARAQGYRRVLAEGLVQLGIVERARGRYEPAEASFSEGYWAALEAGNDRVATRSALLLVHLLAFNLARPDEAEQWLRTAGAEIERVGGGDDLAASLLDAKGSLFQQRGDFAAAVAADKGALAIRERISGADSFDAASSLNDAASGLFQLGEMSEAIAYLERSMMIHERKLGPRHPNVAAAAANLGSALSLVGRKSDAVGHLRRSLSSFEQIHGPSHPMVAYTSLNLGLALSMDGEFDQAVAQFERALRIHVETLGPKHPQVASTLGNLGVGLGNQGKPAEAAHHLERALAIAEAHFDADHPQIATLCNDFGRVLIDTKDHVAAERQLRRALAIRERVFGLDNPETGNTVHLLGRAAFEREDFSAAGTYYARALAIRRRSATDPRQIADSQFHLGRALWRLGRDRGQAVALAEAARARYTEIGAAERLATVDEWLSGRAAG